MGPAPGVLAAAQQALWAPAGDLHALQRTLEANLKSIHGVDVLLEAGHGAVLRAVLEGTRHVWRAMGWSAAEQAVLRRVGVHPAVDMHGADVLWFDHPAPFGSVAPAASELMALAESWPGCRVVVDETQLCFGEAQSCLTLDLPDNAWVIHDMGLSFGMPGLPLVWVAGRDVQAVREMRTPDALSAPVAAAGMACLEQLQWHKQAGETVAQWRQSLKRALSELPEVAAVDGRGLMVRVFLNHRRSGHLREALVRHGRVLIQDSGGDVGHNGDVVAVAVAAPHSQQQLLQAWKGLGDWAVDL